MLVALLRVSILIISVWRIASSLLPVRGSCGTIHFQFQVCVYLYLCVDSHSGKGGKHNVVAVAVALDSTGTGLCLLLLAFLLLLLLLFHFFMHSSLLSATFPLSPLSTAPSSTW